VRGTAATAWVLGTPGASGTVLEVQYPYHRAALLEYLGPGATEPASFCSAELALELARRARARALAIIAAEACGASNASFSSVMGARPAVGVACTGALATGRERRGEDRAHVAVSRSDGGGERVVSVSFSRSAASTREQQDWIVSELLTLVLCGGGGEEEGEADPIAMSPARASLVDELAVRPLANSWSAPSLALAELARGARSEPLWLWPCAGATGAVAQEGLRTDVLFAPAPRLLLLPGSFNPLHEGHERMLSAAAGKLGSVLAARRGTQTSAACAVLPAFEMSVHNVDKASLVDSAALSARAAQFSRAGRGGPWPVVVTAAPRFADKARLFPGSVFLVGFDTAVRLVDAKYYGGDAAAARAALAEIVCARGCEFVVCGRLVAGQGYKTLENMIESVPSELRYAFHGLSEEEYRVDLSSTELRKRGVGVS
jgi:hypothetical protein